MKHWDNYVFYFDENDRLVAVPNKKKQDIFRRCKMEIRYYLTEEEKKEFEELKKEKDQQWDNWLKEIPKLERFGMGLFGFILGIFIVCVLIFSWSMIN